MARGKRHCHRHNEVEDQREVADESVAGASFRKAPENTQTSERGGAEGATLAERVRRMREERRRQLRRTAATAKDAPTALKRPNKNCPQVLPVSDGRRPTTAPEVVSRAHLSQAVRLCARVATRGPGAIADAPLGGGTGDTAGAGDRTSHPRRRARVDSFGDRPSGAGAPARGGDGSVTTDRG
eukprot:ctg_100.g103